VEDWGASLAGSWGLALVVNRQACLRGVLQVQDML